MEHDDTTLRSRIARLTLGGGFLISAVGSCVGQLGVSAGEVGQGVALALISLGLGVPLMLYGNRTRRSLEAKRLADAEAATFTSMPNWRPVNGRTLTVLPQNLTGPTPMRLSDTPFSAVTEEFPGGGFDISMETDPSLDLQITVVTGSPLRVPEPVEQWLVVEASSALFGPLSAGAA